MTQARQEGILANSAASAASAVSAEPSSRVVDGAGASLHLLDYGNESAQPVVLVHGIRDLAWSMDVIARPLAESFHVLSIDLRGHGDSEKTGSYSQPLYVADLHCLLDGLALKDVVLIGHSLGGQVVCRYAALFPENVRGVVSIEGLGPPSGPDESEQDARRQVARARVEMLTQLRAQGRVMRDVAEATQRVSAKHPALDPGMASSLAEKGTKTVEGGVSWKWDPRVQSTWASVTREDNEQHWQWIDCPVLVVTGGRAGDFWRERRGMRGTPRGGLPKAELERRLACFPRVSHEEIADSGHMVHFDAPTTLNRHIRDFLRRIA